jgi:Protein of unknown function (DUF3592)
MKRWNHSLFLLALGVPGLIGSLAALPLRGAVHWLPVLAHGAMCMWGLAIFLAGLISLLGTRTFLRKAASAKGHVSDIYEVTLAEASDYLFPSRIVTVQFWTEQEESIEFQSPTFQGNPETVNRSIPVLYDPHRPAEARIRSFERLWLTSGLVMVIGAGFSLIFTGLFASVLR